VTTPTTLHAEPDEIELHARDVDRLTDWLGDLMPPPGVERLPGPSESRLTRSEQSGADLPGWPELCAAVVAHEAATLRAQRVLLARLQTMAGDAHRFADQLRGVDEAADRAWERLP
jgi:hypothetical protein